MSFSILIFFFGTALVTLLFCQQYLFLWLLFWICEARPTLKVALHRHVGFRRGAVCASNCDDPILYLEIRYPRCMCKRDRQTSRRVRFGCG